MSDHRDLLRRRQELDEIDGKMVELLGERFVVTEEIGRIKAEQDLPALDASREAEQRSRLRELAKTHQVPLDVVETVFAAVTTAVRRRHEEIRKAGP